MIVEWVPDRGPPIPLGLMSTAHVRNCIAFLLSGQMVRPGCSGFTNAEWLMIFRCELVKRIRSEKLSGAT